VAGLADVAWGPGVHVVVEVPRDERRQAVVDALAAAGIAAKLRTGGTSAELYPDEHELATAVHALVTAEVPFKATAGLHHALRNTDPETGFEQHGFLNVMVATDAALRGADVEELAVLLAERDRARVVEQVRTLADNVASRARTAFTSFGTCSITEPVEELAALGLLSLPAQAPA
jgi:predicted xylose isomerase-like sugar epimerase